MQRNDRSYKDLKQKQKSAIADKTYKMHLKFYLEKKYRFHHLENPFAALRSFDIYREVRKEKRT